MKYYKHLILFFTLSFSFSALAFPDEPKHNDKEHEKAESNLDHKHWKEAHGSGKSDKKEGQSRSPGGRNSKNSSKKGVIKEG